MPRFLPLATVAAAVTSLLLLLGGGPHEALASELDELPEVTADEQREMIGTDGSDATESSRPQLEGRARARPNPFEAVATQLEEALRDVHVTRPPVGELRITGLVRSVGLPELLGRIRATPWQREAIAQILHRARLEMTLLKDVRNHEGLSWAELNRDVLLGHRDTEAFEKNKERIAQFHASRVACSDETFEQAAVAIKQEAVERVSDLLDNDQDKTWRGEDKRWALRDLSFLTIVARPTCWLRKPTRRCTESKEACIG